MDITEKWHQRLSEREKEYLTCRKQICLLSVITTYVWPQAWGSVPRLLSINRPGSVECIPCSMHRSYRVYIWSIDIGNSLPLIYWPVIWTTLPWTLSKCYYIVRDLAGHLIIFFIKKTASKLDSQWNFMISFPTGKLKVITVSAESSTRSSASAYVWSVTTSG